MGVILPGGTAVVLAGFGARSQGAAGFAEVAIGAWLGMLAGTSVDYWLGRVAGRHLVPAAMPWRLATRWRQMLRASRRFMRRWGWWAIIAASVAGPGRASIAVAAGASGWSFTSYLAGQAIASAIWSALYVGIGFFAAGGRSRVEQVASGAGMALGLLLLAAVLGPWAVTGGARWLARALRPAFPRPRSLAVSPVEVSSEPRA